MALRAKRFAVSFVALDVKDFLSIGKHPCDGIRLTAIAPAIALPAPQDERILRGTDQEDRDERATGKCHPRMAGRRLFTRAELDLHRPTDLRARTGAHLRRGRLALCVPRSRNPQPRRLQAQPTRQPRCRCRPRYRWRCQRSGESLRPSQHAGLHRQPRLGEGIRLPVSPMDLRSRRQPARRAVPPRLSRPGRYARRLSHRGPRPAAPLDDAAEWCGVRQLWRTQRVIGDLSR